MKKPRAFEHEFYDFQPYHVQYFSWGGLFACDKLTGERPRLPSNRIRSQAGSLPSLPNTTPPSDRKWMTPQHKSNSFDLSPPPPNAAKSSARAATPSLQRPTSLRPGVPWTMHKARTQR